MDRSTLTAIITGGAGGIGIATLRHLAERFDGRVGLFDLDKARLAETRDQFQRSNFKILPYAFDLRDSAALKQATEDFCTGGQLDVLFANAGIMTGHDAFEALLPEALDRSIDINFRAIAQSTHIAWPFLKAAQGAVIINASGAGKWPLKDDVIYSASKAAAIMFAKASAMRFEETGIRFNAVCPGVVDTPILTDPETGTWRRETQAFAEQFEIIQPDEIAEAVLTFIEDKTLNGEVTHIMNKSREAV